MSIFGNIVNRIVSLAEETVGVSPARASATAPAADTASPSAAAEPVPGGGAVDTTSSPAADATQSATAAAGSAPALHTVDIGAVLSARAAGKNERLDWEHSIVDLLKVLDLDSSLSARKELAGELDVHAGADGSAEENEALHRAVVAKLEENGGNIPAGMK